MDQRQFIPQVSSVGNTGNRRLELTYEEQNKRGVLNPLYRLADSSQWKDAENTIGAEPRDKIPFFIPGGSNGIIDYETGMLQTNIPKIINKNVAPPSTSFMQALDFQTIQGDVGGGATMASYFGGDIHRVAFNQPQYNFTKADLNIPRIASTQQHVNGLLFDSAIESIGDNNNYNKCYDGVDILTAFNMN
jgi:hypothetical protein